MKKDRESKYETLRIVSMFMIVIWHILIHGHVLGNTTGGLQNVLRLVEVLLAVHVNSFILVTGYFQSSAEFKLKNFWRLNNAAWFYRVVIITAFSLLGIMTFGRVDIVKNIIPIDFGFYWFLDIYLILYLISPFLNILIKAIKKSEFEKLIIVSFILFSLLPTLTRQQAYYNIGGSSLVTFVMLYFVGAYLRLYKEEISRKLKELFKCKNVITYLCIFIVLATLNYVSYRFGISILDKGRLVNELGTTLVSATFAYDNPLVILGSISYFLLFTSFNFTSSLINKLSPYVFGVYLISDNPYVRIKLYELFGLYEGKEVTSYFIIIKIIVIAIVIFVGCIVIEYLRVKLFSLTSQLFKRLVHPVFKAHYFK